MESGTSEERKYCVYLITNLVNGKQYAGQTGQGCETRRWKAHLQKANKGTKGKFANALRKYGKDSFHVSVFREGLTKEEAYREEILLIQHLHLRDTKLGYNSTNGGDGGELNEESIAQICESKGMKKDPLCGGKYFIRTLPTEELIRDYEKGLSTPELSEKYGVDHGTIRRRLLAANVALRTMPEWKKLANERMKRGLPDEKIVSLYQEGWSTVQIGEMVGRGKSAIWHRLKLLGIPRRPVGKQRTRHRENEVGPAGASDLCEVRQAEEIGSQLSGQMSTSF